MKNKNLWIILGVVALIALVAVLGVIFGKTTPALDSGAPSLATDAPVVVTSPSGEVSVPTATPETTESTAGPEASPVPANAYLLVTVRGQLYQPLPLVEEGDFTLRQTDTGAENVVHVTADSVSMKSSSCENQDCVQQGTVTLDNMESRILGNMIICLPNEVTLELYTPDQLYGLFVQPSKEQ